MKPARGKSLMKAVVAAKRGVNGLLRKKKLKHKNGLDREEFVVNQHQIERLLQHKDLSAADKNYLK